MATKKARTRGLGKELEGPLYVTGNTIKELRAFISELPDDITISLETSPHYAAPLAFDRVVTGTNHRGEAEQIALFHEVTKESLGAIRAKAAAGELPRLDSTRRTPAPHTAQDVQNLALAREAEAAFDEMHFNILPGETPTHEQQKYFDAAQSALANLITLLEGKPIETYRLNVRPQANSFNDAIGPGTLGPQRIRTGGTHGKTLKERNRVQ